MEESKEGKMEKYRRSWWGGGLEKNKSCRVRLDRKAAGVGKKSLLVTRGEGWWGRELGSLG